MIFRPFVRLALLTSVATASVLVADDVRADPCEAPLPARGEVFYGQVRHVIDGDGFCVGPGPDPATWIEVRLADVYAAELNEPGGRRARQLMSDLVLGRRVGCVAGRRSFDRVVASCTLGGRDLGAAARAILGPPAGRGR